MQSGPGIGVSKPCSALQESTDTAQRRSQRHQRWEIVARLTVHFLVPDEGEPSANTYRIDKCKDADAEIASKHGAYFAAALLRKAADAIQTRGCTTGVGAPAGFGGGVMAGASFISASLNVTYAYEELPKKDGPAAAT